MNHYTRLLADAALCCGVLLAAVGDSHAQTLINLGTQSRNIDFTGVQTTRPVKMGSSLPSGCSNGEFFFNTSASAGQNLYSCLSNSWTNVGGSAALQDPGSNGIVKRTAPNTTVAVPAPSGTIVGTTDAQTLTNKSIDASEINSGTIPSARMPALSGDLTTGAGSTATVLSSVNSTPGSFGDATHAVQLTVDAKGRVTGVSQVAIAAGGTGLTTVNSTPGSFGSSTQIPVITVNGYGQITAVSTVAAAGGGSGTGTAAGTLAAIPATCSVGTLYVASDQPVSQQLYACSSLNTWTQYMSLGGSGALAITNGALDVVTSVVPRLAAANTFTGLNTFPSGVRMGGVTQPSCDTNARGLFWYQNNGSAKDGVQVCVYTGSAFAWTSLY
jgi:trimeric autotransporter adhesin